MCPADINKLGYTWQGKIYIDRVLAMGLRSASMCCQRITNVVSYICGKAGANVVNYADDLAGAALEEHGQTDCQYLGEVLDAGGLEEALEKGCGVACVMVFLGVLFDTISMTMSVTAERVKDTLSEAQAWECKQFASKKEVQSLLGKLQFICKCVRQGRVFVARILNFLRSMGEGAPVPVPEQMKKDVRWFGKFLPTYNGVSMIPPLHWENLGCGACDRCLSGGVWGC